MKSNQHTAALQLQVINMRKSLVELLAACEALELVMSERDEIRVDVVSEMKMLRATAAKARELL